MFDENDSATFTNRIQELLNDASVSKEEKIRALEDVRLDLLERQRATEENMDPKSATDAGKTGDQLQQITKALTTLREGESGSS